MNVSLKKDQAALMKEEGKLKKFFVAVKKFFAKEFLWVVFVVLLGLPLALILNYLLKTFGSIEVLRVVDELLDEKPQFVGCYAISCSGIYFTRAVIGAINLMVNQNK
jgi:hypothetical protein